MEKYICIHGHFYQPPRENAWLEAIEVQDSAHPYHDWNERISAECYAPNAASRILENGIIKDIINNYSRISFNFGATLLSWMENYDQDTYQAILEADRQSVLHFSGHGSAMAQVYNHIIMPLANRQDKITQIVWGIRDFEHRFKRKPEGMWLAESAVDTDSLELLAAHDIKFTVLAPRQAKAFRRTGDEHWHELRDSGVDTRRPYVCRLPSGRTIILFFYNGDIAQRVAFNGLLNDGQKFAQALLGAFNDQSNEHQLVHIATDGETYGHHHKHGDMALAYCLDYVEQNKQAKITNYAEYIAKVTAEYEIQIHENSSWSCVHGVERWRSDCGCNSGGREGWNQKWRQPLRESLDWLRDQLNEVYANEASRLLHDPWEARNAYIEVILNRDDDTVQQFFKQHGRHEVDQSQVLRLMEMQRNAQLMYTSCGWFFDEISGIETTQILQYACRAIQLISQTGGKDLEEEFMRRLETAPSNIPALENGANVYVKYVVPAKTNLARVGMHYAVASLFEEDPEHAPLFNYSAVNEFFLRKEAGEQKLALGVTKVKSNVTRSEKRFTFAVVHIGKHNIMGNISLDMEADKFASMQMRILTAFEEGRLGDVISLMQTYFGPVNYTLWQLFKDEKRRVLEMITQQSMRELEESLRRVYNHDYPLVNALVNNDIPTPKAYTTTFEYILNADLLNCFKTEKINILELERVMEELIRWNLAIEDPGKVSRMAGESIFKELKRISAERSNTKRIEKLNRVFPLLKEFKLEPILYKSQNLYFEISREEDVENLNTKKDWSKQFKLLGENLGVKVG